MNTNSKYLSWIPCVLGRLDFSKVNAQEMSSDVNRLYADSICFSYQDEHNFSDSKERPRYNLISTVYDWKDRDEEGYSGLFRTISFGCVQNGKMAGTNFIIKHVESEKGYINFFNDIVSRAQELENEVKQYHISLRQKPYDCEKPLDEDYVKREFASLKKLIEEAAKTGPLKDRIIAVEYEIEKNGLVELSPHFRENLPKDKELIERNSSFIAAKQMFIFLKYVYHTHKHHDKAEDKLTSIHKVNKEDKLKTANYLVDDLRRAVIELKDKEVLGKETAKHSLQGFVSYSKSLILALHENDWLTKDEADRKSKYFNNMLLSWNALVNKTAATTKREELTEESRSKAKTEALQLLSIWLTITTILITVARFLLGEESMAKAIIAKAKTDAGTFFSAWYASVLEKLSQPDLILKIVIPSYAFISLALFARFCFNTNGIIARCAKRVSIYIKSEKIKKTLVDCVIVLLTALIIVLFYLLMSQKP